MPRDVCNGGKEGAGCRVRQGAGSVGAVVSHVRGMWMYCIGLPRARPPVWLTVGRGRSELELRSTGFGVPVRGVRGPSRPAVVRSIKGPRTGPSHAHDRRGDDAGCGAWGPPSAASRPYRTRYRRAALSQEKNLSMQDVTRAVCVAVYIVDQMTPKSPIPASPP